MHIREVFSSPPYAYSPRTLSLKHKFDWLTDKDKHKTQKRLHIFFKIDRGPVYHVVSLVTWVKISTEDFTDETLAIDDTQGVDVNLI